MLREIERIMGMLEGEIRYRKNPLGHSFKNIGNRCGGVYGEWLLYMSQLMQYNEIHEAGFTHIWNTGLDWLLAHGKRSCINSSDINSLKYVGQALENGDIDTQINALMLEKTVLQNRISELSNEVKGKSKIALSLCGLGGIFVVICLAL